MTSLSRRELIAATGGLAAAGIFGVSHAEAADGTLTILDRGPSADRRPEY
jgi:hypothetical protein